MFMLLVGVVTTTFAFFVLRPAYRQFVLGQHLSRLTSLTEEAEQNRLIGVHPYMLPINQRRIIDDQWRKGLEVFRRYPPEIITRELLKNSIIASRLGRNFREIAIGLLIDRLADQGVAVGLQLYARDMFAPEEGV